MTDTLRVAAALVNVAHRQLAYAERLLFAALTERAARPGRQPAECGSQAGYMAHLRAGETPCAACYAGHAWAGRHRRGRGAA